MTNTSPPTPTPISLEQSLADLRQLVEYMDERLIECERALIGRPAPAVASIPQGGSLSYEGNAGLRLATEETGNDRPAAPVLPAPAVAETGERERVIAGLDYLANLSGFHPTFDVAILRDAIRLLRAPLSPELRKAMREPAPISAELEMAIDEVCKAARVQWARNPQHYPRMLEYIALVRALVKP